MRWDVTIDKAENGYIVRTPFYLKIETRVFKTFGELVDFLQTHFDETYPSEIG